MERTIKWTYGPAWKHEMENAFFHRINNMREVADPVNKVWKVVHDKRQEYFDGLKTRFKAFMDHELEDPNIVLTDDWYAGDFDRWFNGFRFESYIELTHCQKELAAAKAISHKLYNEASEIIDEYQCYLSRTRKSEIDSLKPIEEKLVKQFEEFIARTLSETVEV